jgi:peptide chain release factor subunit 1
MKEKAILQDYFQAMALDSGLYSIGITQTMKALEMGAVSSLLIWNKFQVSSVSLVIPLSLSQYHSEFRSINL